MLNSGFGPRFSVWKRHASFSVLKFEALIWSSGEYFVLPRSAPYVRHSPTFAPVWAASGDTPDAKIKAAIVNTLRVMQFLNRELTSRSENCIPCRRRLMDKPPGKVA